MQRFSAFHPLSSFLYLMSVICITMFSQDPIITSASLVGALLFSLSLKALKNMWIYILILVLTTATNPIFSHNGITVLFFLNGNPITLEAIFYGAYLGGMIVSVLLWFSCYNKVITSDKFLSLFGRIMPKAALIITMALRFVPVFIKDGKKLVEIHGSLDTGRASPMKRVKRYVAVFSCLVTRSLEGAVETSNSMKARGYGENKRVSYSRYNFNISDLVLLVITIFSMVIIITSGDLSYGYYPEMDNISFSYSTALCIGYFLLPSVINLWGEIKWKFWVSKI